MIVMQQRSIYFPNAHISCVQVTLCRACVVYSFRNQEELIIIAIATKGSSKNKFYFTILLKSLFSFKKIKSPHEH